MLDFMNPERAGRRALVCLVRLPSLGVSSPDLGRLWQRRRPFFLCAPTIVFRVLWGTEQSAGTARPHSLSTRAMSCSFSGNATASGGLGTMNRNRDDVLIWLWLVGLVGQDTGPGARILPFP